MRSVLFAALVCACGDNHTGISIDEFNQAKTAAQCARFARCGLFQDKATCQAFFRKRPDRDLEAAVAAGVVRYEGASAERCLEALADATCDGASREARVLPRACEDMFVGSLTAGEPCALDEECISGACDVPLCGELCCVGTCRPAVAFASVGEACERDDDCVPDAFCGDDSTCEVLGLDGDICRADRQCAFGFGCIGATPQMPGNCRALGANDEPCPYLRCAEIGASCKNGHCTAVGLPGDPCTSAADCSPFVRCDLELGRCAPVPSLGEACLGACAGEAYCDPDAQICVAPRENTAPCSAANQCESLFCAEGPAFDACADRPLCL